MFADSLVPQEAWAVLDKLDEKIPLKWIMPNDGGYVPLLNCPLMQLLSNISVTNKLS